MKRYKVRKKGDTPQLEMTPMIDVVFQLLIFFIVTLKEEDILSHLDVWRPAPDPQATPEEKLDLLTITVFKDGYVLGGRPVSKEELDRQVSRIGSINKNTSVIVRCTNDSPHRHLVQVLDICAKAGLKQLSVFSL